MHPALKVVDNALPDPPYPVDTKANGWKPEFDIDRIYQSDTWTLAESDERPWLLRIWLESWRSVPVGSMSSDHNIFARRVGCSRQFLEAHKDVLLRGWVLHADGRLYHEHISGQIYAMLSKRRSQADRVKAYRKKKQQNQEKAPQCSNNVHASSTQEQEQEQEQEEEKTPQKETGRSNRHVENPAAKPQNPIAAVERDAPDLSVLDFDSQTKTPDRAVFDYWREKMGHPKAKLASKRRNAIKARLKEGYTVADISLAIDGCKASDWHQGKNDRKTVFDDIELICRDATKLDAFIAKAGESAKEKEKMDAFLSGTFKSALYPDPTNQDNTIEGEFHAI